MIPQWRQALHAFSPMFVITGMDEDLIPDELVALRGVPQAAKYHPEGDAYRHSLLTADAIGDRPDSPLSPFYPITRPFLVLTALCHDLGKVSTTIVHDDGRITAHGHDDAGVPLVASFINKIEAPSNWIAPAQHIIAEHMCVACAPENVSRRVVNRLLTRLGPASFWDWVAVCEADHMGRGTASKTGITDPWVARYKEIRTS